jgi:hypothetical protein
MQQAKRQMPAQAGRAGVARGEAARNPVSDEESCPRYDTKSTGSALLMTEAIIVMAHKLGIKTIAERVETEAQKNLLKSIGCDYFQGFLYSPAVPAAECEKMIAKQS